MKIPGQDTILEIPREKGFDLTAFAAHGTVNIDLDRPF
jgi:hypothetical protein